MTLIAFTNLGDSMEFITDTGSYSTNVEIMGSATKHLTINHLDAAVLTQGDTVFGDLVHGGALQAGGQVATFDELVRTARPWLQRAWTDAADRRRHSTPPPSIMFFLGWSGEAGRFLAWGFDSLTDFEPFQITEPWVMPTPWTMRPSARELKLDREHLIWRGNGDRVDEIEQIRNLKPAIPVLKGTDQWRDFAIHVRDERALHELIRTIVAGKVIHTRMKRGLVVTKTIHEFNDAGEEFVQMVQFTQHPVGQVAPCWCDSGERYIDCHLAPHLDEPCGCGTGVPFRDCCMVGSADRGTAVTFPSALVAG